MDDLLYAIFAGAPRCSSWTLSWLVAMGLGAKLVLCMQTAVY